MRASLIVRQNPRIFCDLLLNLYLNHIQRTIATQAVFRLIHHNCLIFGTKVNIYIDNSYTCFVNFYSSAIPINPLKKTKMHSLVNS